MTVCRGLLMLVLAAVPLGPASAQFSGMPPGVGMPSMSPRPAEPPAECKQLLTWRDDLQKYGNAVRQAGERKLPAAETCKRFKALQSAHLKLIKGLEQHSRLCGVPPEVPKQMKPEQTKIAQVMKQVCDAAARGPAAAGPSLSDALGTSRVPDAGTTSTGRGTLDTLTGNPLAR